jgi:hypothetical protein
LNGWRDFPPVGARVSIDYGPENHATWPCSGEVRAIVDDEIMVVRRWVPSRKAYTHECFTVIQWHVWKDHFNVVDD